VNDEAAEQQIRKMLQRSHVEMAAVDFFHCRTDRSWTRDFCPIFVRDERAKPVILDWQFNGWAKYDNWQVDDAVPAAIAGRLKMRAVQPKIGQRRSCSKAGAST
jgi:agmatine deiminase